MKKLLTFILTIACIFSSVNVVWGADELQKGDKVEFSFKIGDSAFKVNGKEITVAKPTVVNGVTLVPIRVISEAFGCEVNWDETERSITIKYSDVVIKFTIDNKTAIINGREITLLEAPTIIDGTTMVPLRTITENFGAEIKCNSQTSEITVTKEIASSTSIKDFSMVLKKTSKDRVGDSYYGWSMALPKNLKISYRDFNGTYNLFTTVDETYYLEVFVKKQEDQTLDTLMASMLEYVKDYTIINYSKENENGQAYTKFVYKDSKYTYEDRRYINGNTIFILNLYVKDYDTYKNSKEIPDILNSFATSFDKNGKIEDLSDVTKSGYRAYKNSKLKWSVNVLPDWEEYKDKNKDNEISFTDIDNNAFFVNMYSVEDGLTLDSWIEDEIKDIGDKYNKKYISVSKVEDYEINKVKCKKLYATITDKGFTTYTCDVYIVGKDYRYNFGYRIDSKVYNDAAQMAKIDAMVRSFRFTEPKVEDVGKLMDPAKILNSNVTKKLSSKDYKWALEIPVKWRAMDTNNDKDCVSYSSDDGNMLVEMSVKSEGTFDGYVNGFEYYVSQNPNKCTVDNRETLNAKGTSVKKFTATLTIDDTKIKEEYYILAKNGKVYLVMLWIADIAYTDRNKQIINKIWDSIVFE